MRVTSHRAFALNQLFVVAPLTYTGEKESRNCRSKKNIFDLSGLACGGAWWGAETAGARENGSVSVRRDPSIHLAGCQVLALDIRRVCADRLKDVKTKQHWRPLKQDHPTGHSQLRPAIVVAGKHGVLPVLWLFACD